MGRLSVYRLVCSVALLLILPSGGWMLLAAHQDGVLAPALPDLPAKVTFNKHIRPILSDRCFTCHGPDINKRISGLRLDLRPGPFAPLPKHPQQFAFVPGKPQQSQAYLRIISQDAGEVMPPATSHLKLNDYEKALIRRWIEQGAIWEDHWAFVPPVRPEVPAIRNSAWPHNDVDKFILARLEREGLPPAAEADKTTLIRRVALDLTGIPPTPAEVDAFLADTAPNAYEKVVDRLLASPHYGEQMAISWLDYARYADSHGYQGDPERFMFHWRDWVINAYNQNMPFDEFTLEQLAGDLLPDATDEQKIATGFNRNHRMNSEGGALDEEWRIENVIDRVETTSGTWLGLTMGCCRCHDHKYDPITQKEFYQFSAYFNNNNEIGAFYTLGIDGGANMPPLMRVFTPAEKQHAAEVKATLDSAEATLLPFRTQVPDLEKKFRDGAATATEPRDLAARFPLDGKPEGLDGAARPIAAKLEGKPTFVDGPQGKALKVDGDGSAINAGDSTALERTQAATWGAWVNIHGAGSIVARMDSAGAYRGFDIFISGDKISTHLINTWPTNALKLTTTTSFPKDKWFHVMVSYDGSSKAGGVRIYFDGKVQPTATDSDTLTGTIVTQVPFMIGRRLADAFFSGQVADVRFYRRALGPDEISWLANHQVLASLVQIAPERRTPVQQETLAGLLLAGDPEYARINARIQQARQEYKQLKEPAPNAAGGPNTTMIMQELAKPRDTFILLRGQYDKHGEKVESGIPAILAHGTAVTPPNRLGLAKWIIDPANPLTARVQANRLWEKFFGVGLVKTSENLGTQGDWPSNPELLDFLATEMVRLKWDLKAFQKQLVTSAAYRQDSTITPDMLERDPDNRLLARGPRFRLPSETVRDQALAASGLLVDKIGGPSVKPYEPGNLWEGNVYGNLGKYNADHGENLYRRSLYTFWKRTAPPPNLAVFDMPGAEVCVVKRSRTNTPLQALDLLNDPTYVEAARGLGQRMLAEGGQTPATRIAYGFRCVTCRKPNDAESRILLDLFQDQLGRFRANPDAATKFLSVGESPRDPKVDAAELAAYAMTASTILNLDEAVTKQ